MDYDDKSLTRETTETAYKIMYTSSKIVDSNSKEYDILFKETIGTFTFPGSCCLVSMGSHVDGLLLWGVMDVHGGTGVGEIFDGSFR